MENFNESGYQYISKPIQRVSGFSIATGAAIYADDLAPSDCLILKLLRSPYPAAEIESIKNIDLAKKIAGVVAVFTWEDIPSSQHYLACGGEGEVRDRVLLTKYPKHEGDPVALVAAETERAALKALKVMKPVWKKKEPVMDVTKAYKSDTLVYRDDIDEIILPFSDNGYDSGDYNPHYNQVKDLTYDFGNADEIVAASEFQAECTTYTGQQAHAMLETHRSYCHIDSTGRYVITGPFQTAHPTLHNISTATGIDIRKLRMVKSQVGGAFGGKNLLIPELYTAFATHKTGRPTKLILTRKECFMASGTRHASYITTRVGADKDGKVTAISSEWITDAGAYAEVTGGIMFTGIHNILPLYTNVKDVKVHQLGLYTNKITGCAFRGFGAPQTAYNFNLVMTLLAAKLNMSIIDFHLKNIGVVGDTHPLMEGNTAKVEVVLTSTTLKECIQTGKELIGWDEKIKRKEDSRYYYGVGMAIAAHGSGVSQVHRGNASIRLNFNETFTIFSGHSEIGTGSDTVITQIAAEILHVPMDTIRLISGDSDLTPYDTGTYGSSNVFVNGNAVRIAAEKMYASMLEQAKKYLHIENTDIDLEFDGRNFFSTDHKYILSFHSFCYHMTSYETGRDNLEETSSYACHISPSPFVTCYVDIRIDKLTGKILLDECINVVDCGNVMNPNYATVQIQGGAAQSIGFALYEDYRYSEINDKLLTHNYQSYKIPCQMDIPNIKAVFTKNYDPNGPFGAKSIGEIAINAPAPAIANAVFNCTGILMEDLPMTPEKVLSRLIQKEKGVCSF